MNTTRKEPRLTPTAILCELTKLRSQQHYLETGNSKQDKIFPVEVPFLQKELDQQHIEYRACKWSDVEQISELIRGFSERMLSNYGIRCNRTIEYRNEVLRIDTLLREALARNENDMAELRVQRVAMCQDQETTRQEVLLNTSNPVLALSRKKNAVFRKMGGSK